MEREGDQESSELALTEQIEATAAGEQAEKPRRGRRPKVQDMAASGDEDVVRILATPEQVTYTPGPGDNPETVWMGHKFQAHIPRPVTNARLVESAKGNKFFHVGEFDVRHHTYKETVSEPRTAEAYRAWAVLWFKKMETIEQFAERWANEARMRAKLEVGFDDYHYISSIAQPKIDELISREEEPRKVRDEIIRKREFADLELQIAGVGQSA